MMKHLEISMEIWDNDISTEDRQHILLYCEHALMKTWLFYRKPQTCIKITKRWHGGWTTKIELDGIDAVPFLRSYNLRLHRLHYWNREDEPLVMHWDIHQDNGGGSKDPPQTRQRGEQRMIYKPEDPGTASVQYYVIKTGKTFLLMAHNNRYNVDRIIREYNTANAVAAARKLNLKTGANGNNDRKRAKTACHKTSRFCINIQSIIHSKKNQMCCQKKLDVPS